MIQNYNDPRVVLTQVYKAQTTGVNAALGACVIGPNYIVRAYQDLGSKLRLDSSDNYPADEYSNSFSPEQGITERPYPATEANDGDVDTKTVKVLVKDAEIEYDNFSDSFSITLSDYDTIQIAGVVFNGTHTTLPVPVEVGDTATLKLVNSDSTEVTVSRVIAGFLNNSVGKPTKCVLAQEVPNTVTKVSYISFNRVQDVYLDSTSVTAGTKTIKVGAEATATTTFNNITAPRSVMSGAFYAQYRVMSLEYVGKYGLLAGEQSVEDILGKVCPQNPLGIAVAAAAEAADTAFVYFTAVNVTEDSTQTELVQAYEEAADLIADTNGIYGIVPCTSNAAVLKSLFNFVVAQSQEEIPFFKFLYGSVDIPTQSLVVDDGEVSARSFGTTYTKVTLKNNPFLSTINIVKGDVLRVFNAGGYTDFTISYSDNKASVYIEGDVTTNIPVGSVVDVYHTVTSNADRVATIVAEKPIANRRACLAFADGAVYDGYEVPNYCVAAAIAGLRSASACHAPLSNVTVPGITTTEEHGFTASQSKILGANGFWRVGQDYTGATISKRQLTSAAAGDVNYDEQSIVCDIDYVCLSLKNVGKNYVGNTNISSALIGDLQFDLQLVLDGLSQITNSKLGAILEDYEIVQVKQDSVNKDRVYATINGTPPAPFNQFRITFYFN